MKKDNHVDFDGNVFEFRRRISWPSFVGFKMGLEQLSDVQEIVLDFQRVQVAYSNGMVPIIATLVRYYPSIHIEIVRPNDDAVHSLFKRTGWYHFLDKEDRLLDRSPEHYDNFNLIRFSNDDELNTTNKQIFDWVLQSVEMAKGLPDSFHWITNELAGNVLDHSETNDGWIQVTVFPDNHQIAIVICDTGVGIRATMQRAFPDIKTDLQALEKAITKGVTSNPDIGQGNGLAGSIEVARANEGLIHIISGSGRLISYEDEFRSQEMSVSYPGTMVEFQLKTNKSVQLDNALWGRPTVGYFEMKYEDDFGNLDLRLKDYAPTFGNRPTGRKIRTMLENMLESNPGQSINVDFDGVDMITSSFADELFGRLAIQLGIWQFGQRVRPRNVNALCFGIINNVIEQRIAYKYIQENVTEDYTIQQGDDID